MQSWASTLQTLKIRTELRSVKHFDANHVKAALALPERTKALIQALEWKIPNAISMKVFQHTILPCFSVAVTELLNCLWKRADTVNAIAMDTTD